MSIVLKDTAMTHSVNFGRGRTGLTAEYKVVGSDGITIQESKDWSSTGVTELLPGSGNYGAVFTLTTKFTGYIYWRILSVPLYLQEPIIVVSDYTKILGNRWRITSDQFIIYDDDGSTPLYTFDLKDEAGVATTDNPYERVPA
jgi:hypothetical protein